MSRLTLHPSGPLRGTLNLPGDKSISHRAIIFASLFKGSTTVRNLLESEDILCTIQIFRAMGVIIRHQSKGVWTVKSPGICFLKKPSQILYCGNSGTTMRLMMGVLSALPFKSSLTGDKSLNKRPVKRVITPLKKMGAKIKIKYHRGKRLIEIQGGRVKGVRYRLPVASAQVKSAILLAGLVGGVTVRVFEKVPTRDHTERMIRLFKKNRPRTLIIPGDPSSAAFFVVAGLMSDHSRTKITLRKILINKTRVGFLESLKRMGGSIRITNRRRFSGEPVADLIVTPKKLKGVTIGGRIVPRLIDEVPILAVAAAKAKGATTFKDMAELRVKESDRIRSLKKTLPKFNVCFQEGRSGFTVRGGSLLRGATATSFGDHRIAMSLAILGLQTGSRSRIENTGCIDTSLPSFVPLLLSLGVKVG